MPLFQIVAAATKPGRQTLYYVKAELPHRAGVSLIRICWQENMFQVIGVVYFRNEAEMNEDMACQNRFGNYTITPMHEKGSDETEWLRRAYMRSNLSRGVA